MSIEDAKKEFHNKGYISYHTQYVNSQLGSNIEELNQLYAMYDEEPLGQRVDAGKRLNETRKQVRIIQYQCNNTIAAENEKIITIPSPTVEEGTIRGGSREIEIIENCQIIC